MSESAGLQSRPAVEGPLTGIRVLELGNFIAAPSAGRLMAEFGAEVIKIEKPGGGDQVRHWRLLRGDTSMMWRTLARNKKSVTIDLRTPRGNQLARQLASKADVVLENYRPGTLEAWGLSPEVLRGENPRLVVVRISGYGQTGPYRDRAGFGGVAEALGGLRSVTGYPDRPPTRIGVSVGDSLAGLFGVIGALMGLLARHRLGDGRGETVDVALHEAVYAVMESLIPEYSAYGLVRTRSGNEMPGVAPSNTYPCRDGEGVVIGGNADGIFVRLMQAIGRSDLATDPRFRANQGRAAHSRLLDEAIASWTGVRSLDEVMAVMVEAGVPAGPVYTAREIVEDPHFRARDMFVERAVRVDGAAETVLFPGIVPKLELRPGEMQWPGPELGEHTDDVLGELAGIGEDELVELRRQGVI
jgi:formyl-CoA transferase